MDATNTSRANEPYHDPTRHSAEHNHAAVHTNPDPALNPAFQHTHEHKHHSPRVDRQGHDDNVVYTTGTTVDPSNVPTQVHPHNDGITRDHSSIEKQKAMAHSPDFSDHEKGEHGDMSASGHNHHHETEKVPPRWSHGPLGPVYRHRRILVHMFIFLLFTGWWIASLILHKDDKNWVVPFLLWLAISLRVLFWHVSIKYVSRPIKWTWEHTGVVVYNALPPKLRTPAGALVTIAAILVGSFASEETAENSRKNRAISLFGMALILFVFWLTSTARSKINWRTVIAGMLAQYVIGLFVLRTGVGFDIFSFIAARAGDLLGFARDGVAFLTDPEVAATTNFFFSVIPAIIFFISLVQVLFYVGFLTWFISKFAAFVFWMLGVSGAEAVVAAATPFIGQGESAMLVRPFVPHMTKAELHQIMTCGFATISGSVLVGYIGLGLNPEVLVSSCIMSIPASLAISKMRYPETEETLTAGQVVIPDDDEHKSENALHAFANGAWLGIKIAGSIITSLLCIIAAVGLINGLMTWWGRYLNINHPVLTLQTIFAYLFYPVAWCLGVPDVKNPVNGEDIKDTASDIFKVAKLIAQKVITNEYNAFNDLQTGEYYSELTQRSKLIATYACCGFGNIGSLGIQIGILGQLAPSRGGDVSRLAVSALISGVFATLTSAAVAGLVITTQIQEFTGQSS